MPWYQLVLVGGGNAFGLALAALLIRKYRQAGSKPLLYMLLPTLAVIIYALLVAVMMVLSEGGERYRTGWDMPLVLRIPVHLSQAGVFILAGLFLLKIFRSGERWAQALFVAQAIIIVVSFIIPYFMDNAFDPAPGLASYPTKVLYNVGVISVWVWGIYECFSHWRLYARERAAGKDLDPLVVNRFFLWGLVCVFMLLTVLCSLLLKLGVPIMEQSQLLQASIAVWLIVAGGFMYFSWLPPRWYRARFVSDADA